MRLEVRNISPGCRWKGIQGGAGVMAMSFLGLGAAQWVYFLCQVSAFHM